MEPELKGKGLFVFSDPGGAKPILSYISLNRQVHDFLVVSDRSYDFYSEFTIPVTIYEEGSEKEIIQHVKPDFVFTGTSYTSKIELKFLMAAKEAGIVSYAFIDHYTSFVERFNYQNRLVFPDHICVIDENAAQIAADKQLPVPIVVTGNYYHRFLKHWKPTVSKDFFFESIGVPLSHKLIVFAPDPLSNVGGVEKFGLDELSVWSQVEKALGKIGSDNYFLVIKLHPNQNKSIFTTALLSSPIKNLVVVDSINTNTLLYYADLVIGIYSNILNESKLLGTPVIRTIIGLTGTDPFQNQDIGKVVRSGNMLVSEIKNVINYGKPKDN